MHQSFLLLVYHCEVSLFFPMQTSFRPQKDVRGGIPIFFPQVGFSQSCNFRFHFLSLNIFSYLTSFLLQYGSFKSLDLSGFARNRLWALDSSPAPLPPLKNHSSVDLILRSTNEDVRIWPRRYAYRKLQPVYRNRKMKT